MIALHCKVVQSRYGYARWLVLLRDIIYYWKLPISHLYLTHNMRVKTLVKPFQHGVSVLDKEIGIHVPLFVWRRAVETVMHCCIVVCWQYGADV